MNLFSIDLFGIYIDLEISYSEFGLGIGGFYDYDGSDEEFYGGLTICIGPIFLSVSIPKDNETI